MYDKTLRLGGKRVTLVALTEEHTPLIVRWRNNPAVCQNLYSQAAIIAESHLRYFETQVTTGLCAQFIICINEHMKPIGSVFLKNIDMENRKAEYGIFIGEDDARGKGYGADATRLIVEYGFNTLGLQRIYLSVLSDNSAAIASYERTGFCREGLLRHDFFSRGQYHDVVLMAWLKDEKM